MYIWVKENVNSQKFLMKNIDEIWNTVKRLNLRIVRIEEREDCLFPPQQQPASASGALTSLGPPRCLSTASYGTCASLKCALQTQLNSFASCSSLTFLDSLAAFLVSCLSLLSLCMSVCTPL